MIEQGLFKRHFVGRDGFHWWIGQVAPEETWKNNQPGFPNPDNTAQRGFSQRCRVRIMGHHTACPGDDGVPDNVLPWAYMMYPVTAGSGNRDASTTAIITQGSFCFGFFLDGEEAQTPIIIGFLGHNDYQAVMKNIPPCKFTPFSGYGPEEFRSGNGVKASDSPGLVANQVNGTGENINAFAHESVTNSCLVTPISDVVARESGQTPVPLPQTEQCEPLPLGKIQREIQRIVKEIEKVRRTVSDYRYIITGAGAQAESKINYLINEASKLVSSGMKWVVTMIQKHVIKKVNDGLKSLYFLIFPNQRPALKAAVETANDLIACLFKNIIGKLFGMVSGFIGDTFSKAVNIGTSFVSGFVGQILGQIGGAIKGVLGSVLGPITSIAGKAFDLADNVLGIVKDILSFLSCSPSPDCVTITEWAPWVGGSQLPKFDINSILDQANSLADSISKSDDIVSDINNLDFEFNINFESVLNASTEIVRDQANNIITNTVNDAVNTINSYGINSDSTVNSRAFNYGTPAQTVSTLITGYVTTSDLLSPTETPAFIAANPSATTNTIPRITSSATIQSLNTSTSPATVIPTVPSGEVPTGARACGPPIAVFVDSEGQGASGNLIISPSGEIISYDVISTGVNYTPFTIGYARDDCGRGRGGSITPILGPVKVKKDPNSPIWRDENGFVIMDSEGVPITVNDRNGNVIYDEGETMGVIGILVDESGTDYLTQPDGSFGGEGRTWARPEETIVERSDGTIEIPIPGGEVIDLKPGDIITTPPGSTEITESNDSSDEIESGGEVINGGRPVLITRPGTITTPVVTFEKGKSPYPISSNGSYPAVLYLCQIFVKNTGIMYNGGDEIVIEPNHGAKAVPILGKSGQILSVKVTEPGEGFIEMPEVYVRSETGFNSILTPKFCIDRIGKDQLKEPSEMERLQGKLISVVDCVGKV